MTQIIKINENNTEDADKKKFNISEYFDFDKDKYLIYSLLFYLCGLMIGVSFYKSITSDTLDKILKPDDSSLINLFLSNVTVYMFLFIIVVFLGLCLIGYPIMNIIPAFLGIEYGLKIGYYFVNYNMKGVGYSVLMIVPFCTLFALLISYTLSISAQMSKSLLEITKEGNSEKFDIKPYMKKYSIVGSIIIVASFFNAGITVLLYQIVTI